MLTHGVDSLTERHPVRDAKQHYLGMDITTRGTPGRQCKDILEKEKKTIPSAIETLSSMGFGGFFAPFLMIHYSAALRGILCVVVAKLPI